MKTSNIPLAEHGAADAGAMQAAPPAQPALTPWLMFLLASACGLIVANIYFAQPLVSMIAPDIGLSHGAAGLIVTLTQLGYCLGLLLLVPLGDLVENRRLITATMCGLILALLLVAFASSVSWFLTGALLLGVTAVTVQILVPIAARLAPDASRGSVVGNIMSGTLLGIMLARPVSSLVAGAFGWHTVFAASAVLMLVLLVVLRRFLPQQKPAASQSYSSLIGSMWTLLRDTPVLRRRAAYQAALFAGFSLYWTAIPMVLAGAPFHLSQNGIALFSLAGAAGALSAPLAGRMADRGWTRVATGLSMLAVAAAFLISRVHHPGSLIALLAAGILLDMGAQANLVLSQREIFSLAPEARSRLNGLFMALFFFGGAFGSAVAGAAFAAGGWELVSWVGFAFPIAALLFYASEFRRTAASAAVAKSRSI